MSALWAYIESPSFAHAFFGFVAGWATCAGFAYLERFFKLRENDPRRLG